MATRINRSVKEVVMGIYYTNVMIAMKYKAGKPATLLDINKLLRR